MLKIKSVVKRSRSKDVSKQVEVSQKISEKVLRN